MLTEILRSLIERDLDKLSTEISSYKDEKNLWITDKAISNSGGNLCLHLVGNLNTFIGAQLGNTGYIRNRDLEFSLKDVPREELLEKITRTREMVGQTLTTITSEQLAADYPVILFKDKMSTGHFLAHMAAHLSYHLGQINYHRRLLDVTK